MQIPEGIFLTLTVNKLLSLEKIILTTSESVSGIMVGARWEAVIKLLPEKGVVIITDENVFKIYGQLFPGFPVLKIKPGEDSKQLAVIEMLAKKLLDKGIDRSGFILAIGGGVVSDVAGFLASVYMRGIRCGYVSTTLLSQVDASTGGKNGVNLGVVKNVIGNIRQPEFVICDTSMLQTLSQDEFLSGLAELIKTGIIGDESIIEILENRFPDVMKRDRGILTDLVARSVRFKASVVSEDEKETGKRRILNFGHTFGHAVELHQGVKHGLAIACGMEMATIFSYKKGYISKDERNRIINLLKKYSLLIYNDIPLEEIRRLFFHDKKKSGDDFHFVFTEGTGKATVRK
ncbi:MAG: 3-dehydroquinate synthase, partial [Bacteroidota bacterium]|nr:3-dehydroquinate synthase [Bacteroidota bacterium]